VHLILRRLLSPIDLQKLFQGILLMMRKSALCLGVIALIASGFFLQEAARLVGLVKSPAASTPGGPPNFASWGGAGGGSYPGRPGAGGEDSSAVPVEVAPTEVRGIRERVSGSGILEPEREVTILARVEGEVEELLVEEGQPIESETELCAIDEEPLRIAESIARIEREQTKLAHARLAELIDSRSVSPQELEEARFAMERAAAQYDRAALELAHARPQAPFAGVVVDRAIERGQSVRPGDVLFTIADFEPLRLRLFLPESAVEPIEVGQVAELRSERTGPIIARGAVERVSPIVDRESLTVEVLLQFPFSSGRVRPGSFGHVDIITRTEEDVILVPRRAVISSQSDLIVYRIFEGRAHRTVVLTGYEDESVIQIRSGLSSEDLVATEGLRELRDGSPVEVYRQIAPPLDPLTVPTDGSERGG